MKLFYRIVNYKNGFFFLLFTFLLFWVWVGAAVVTDQRPMDLIRSGFNADPVNAEELIIPTSYFTDQDWIESITPGETTIKALNAENGEIRIRFSQAMSIESGKIVSWSINWMDEEIDFSDAGWENDKVFRIRLNRSMKNGESLRLTCDGFISDVGKYGSQVVLNYE